MRLLTSISAAAALLVPGASLAQTGGAEALGVPAPADPTVTLLDGIAFDLSVSDEESKASVQIGGFADHLVDDNGDARKRTATWSMKLAVPVGGGDDLTSGSSIDALSDGTKLSVSVGMLGMRSAGNRLKSPAFRAIMLDAIERCKDKAKRKTELDTALEGEPRREAIRVAQEACDVAPDPEFAIEHSSYSERAINRTLFSSVWHVGVEASVGVKRFEFLDATTLDALDETKLAYGAAIFAALYPSDAMTAWIGKLEYQRGYESADEAIVCKPVVADPTKDCKEGSPTGPTRTENLNLSLEVRRVFDTGWKSGSFAVAPKGTVDTLSGDYELELPVYFIPRGDLPIAPGFKVSYSSEKEKVAFGLFLRSTFSF